MLRLVRRRMPLVILIPLAWLAVDAAVLALCHVAASADALQTLREPSPRTQAPHPCQPRWAWSRELLVGNYGSAARATGGSFKPTSPQSSGDLVGRRTY